MRTGILRNSERTTVILIPEGEVDVRALRLLLQVSGTKLVRRQIQGERTTCLECTIDGQTSSTLFDPIPENA